MKTIKVFLPALLMLLLLFCAPISAFSQLAPERVEPPFWWAGMHHKEVQLMVYGKDIGLTRAEINHPGVTLREVVGVESPNYLFLTLDISEASPGSIQLNFRLGRRLQYTYNFELLERQTGSRHRRGFDASDAIYLLMPDRFANGNPNNDDMPGMLEKADRGNHNGRHGGDIQGIINNIDYIRDLGFTALWLNPVLENNQPRYSYHGYATTDFYRIDPRFGSNDDFRQLVQIAGKKGIKIIKDMIFNHSGHHHWWMKDLPARDWLNHWPEFTRTTYRMTTIVDPYASRSDYKRMMRGWFDTNMPDLNQRNRLVATYLIQNSVWWIEYAGLRGIRMDTQPYAELEFMAEWGKYVMAEYPYFNIVGEAWMGIPAMIAYFQGGKKNHDGYDSNIPGVFDFSLYDEIGRAFNEDQGWASGMMRLYNSLAMDFLYHDPYNLVIFGDNHDTDRFFTRVGQNKDNLKMALTFLLTTRGIPLIYTGTELLKTAYEHDGHGIMRSDFPGGWPGDQMNAFTPEGRNSGQNEIVNHIRTLLHLRRSLPLFHFGGLLHFVPENNVYVYFRFDETRRVMVIMNNHNSEVNLSMGRFREGFDGSTMAVELLTGKRHNEFGTWSIPAKTAEVYELR